MVAVCSLNSPVSSSQRCKKDAACVCVMFVGLANYEVHKIEPSILSKGLPALQCCCTALGLWPLAAVPTSIQNSSWGLVAHVVVVLKSAYISMRLSDP